MCKTESNFEHIPEHLILSDKVYKLKTTSTLESGRSFNRFLFDYFVEGSNPLLRSDQWRTLLGMSRELHDDYPCFKIPVPAEWLLFRFLCHHVRGNSVHILSGPGGEILSSKNFKSYLGSSVDAEKDEETLKTVLSTWIRTFPEGPIELKDLYVSTDLSLDALKRSINSLKFQNHIEEPDNNTYRIKPSILSNIYNMKNSISLDRKSNRYYQEISIQADEPFCFVIMPFREDEFPQSVYFDVIKPLIEDEFKISCYRVDEDKRPDRIDNKIYTYILRATFIVAEVTTRNPNVMYEIGLAHMLEKDCIILTQKYNSEVPFDINRISAESYKNDDQLLSYLRKSISALAFKINQ